MQWLISVDTINNGPWSMYLNGFSNDLSLSDFTKEVETNITPQETKYSKTNETKVTKLEPLKKVDFNINNLFKAVGRLVTAERFELFNEVPEVKEMKKLEFGGWFDMDMEMAQRIADKQEEQNEEKLGFNAEKWCVYKAQCKADNPMLWSISCDCDDFGKYNLMLRGFEENELELIDCIKIISIKV